MMLNKRKKSRLNITKISVIVLIVSGILASFVYCTNIYDWFTNRPIQQITSSSQISQIQNGINNVQNITINPIQKQNKAPTNTKSEQRLKLSFGRFDTVSTRQSYANKEGKIQLVQYSQKPKKHTLDELLCLLGFILVSVFVFGYFLYKMEKLNNDKK